MCSPPCRALQLTTRCYQTPSSSSLSWECTPYCAGNTYKPQIKNCCQAVMLQCHSSNELYNRSISRLITKQEELRAFSRWGKLCPEIANESSSSSSLKICRCSKSSKLFAVFFGVWWYLQKLKIPDDSCQNHVPVWPRHCILQYVWNPHKKGKSKRESPWTAHIDIGKHASALNSCLHGQNS